VTGINNFIYELVAKRLALLRELVPAAVRVAVLVNPANAQTETTLRDVEAAARAIGLQLQIVKASTSREIDAAFAACATGSTPLFVPPIPCSSAGASKWSNWRRATPFQRRNGCGLIPSNSCMLGGSAPTRPLSRTSDSCGCHRDA
jgi:hypothetical protein